mmetsp:Transcript_309/g.366  ORF Transcript_309/g.366 Transcript_309/m.366 type:complete len:256 (-) Transcript_309:388-1155(-)
MSCLESAESSQSDLVANIVQRERWVHPTRDVLESYSVVFAVLLKSKSATLHVDHNAHRVSSRIRLSIVVRAASVLLLPVGSIIPPSVSVLAHINRLLLSLHTYPEVNPADFRVVYMDVPESLSFCQKHVPTHGMVTVFLHLRDAELVARKMEPSNQTQGRGRAKAPPRGIFKLEVVAAFVDEQNLQSLLPNRKLESRNWGSYLLAGQLYPAQNQAHLFPGACELLADSVAYVLAGLIWPQLHEDVLFLLVECRHL